MSETYIEISVKFNKRTEFKILLETLKLVKKGRIEKSYCNTEFGNSIVDVMNNRKDVDICDIWHEDSCVNFNIRGASGASLFAKEFRDALEQADWKEIVMAGDDNKTATIYLHVWEEGYHFDYQTGDGEDHDCEVWDASLKARLTDIARKMAKKEKELLSVNSRKVELQKERPIRKIVQSGLAIFFKRKNYLKFSHLETIKAKMIEHGWCIRYCCQSGRNIENISARSPRYNLDWFLCLGTRDPGFDLDSIVFKDELDDFVINDRIAAFRCAGDCGIDVPDYCSEDVKNRLEKCYGFYNNSALNVLSLQSKELLGVFTQLLGYEIGDVFENYKEKQCWII